MTEPFGVTACRISFAIAPVDALLERAGNDAERAAHLVILDLHRAESVT